jgi:hypothetical protein
MYDRHEKQNRELQRQQQAHLAEAARNGQAAAEMRELASKDRKHRLRALLWAFPSWRAGGAGPRPWVPELDHLTALVASALDVTLLTRG